MKFNIKNFNKEIKQAAEAIKGDNTYNLINLKHDLYTDSFFTKAQSDKLIAKIKQELKRLK